MLGKLGGVPIHLTESQGFFWQFWEGALQIGKISVETVKLGIFSNDTFFFLIQACDKQRKIQVLLYI